MNMDDLCKGALSKYDKRKPINVSFTFANGIVFNFCKLRFLTPGYFQFFTVDGHRKVLIIRGNNFEIKSADEHVDPIQTVAGEYTIGYWQPRN